MEFRKENSPPQLSCSSASSSSENPGRKELSLEQRRRIDHNFRAAKAILSRKRPRTEASKSPLCQPPPVWAPLSSHERSQSEPGLNQDAQGMHTPPSAVHKLVKSCDMQSSIKPLVLNRNCLLESSPLRREVSNHLVHVNKVSTKQTFFSDAEDSNKPLTNSFAFQNVSLNTNSMNKPTYKPTYSYTNCGTPRVPLGSINCNTSPCHLKGLPTSKDSLDAHKTKQGVLPLCIEEALLPDTDINDITLEQLDAFCSGRAPVVQLPTNRPLENHSSPFSHNASCLSSNSIENGSKMPVVPSTMEESVCKLHATSLSGVGSLARSSSVADTCNSSEAATYHTLFMPMNSQPEVSSMVDSVNNFGGLNQSNSVGTSAIGADTRDLDTQSLQGNADILQVDGDWSSGCTNLTNESRLEPNSESGGQLLSPGVKAVSLHPSFQTELSANAFEEEAVPAYLQKLNDSQKEAVLSDTRKPLLILAGPGSGKTSTMVARLLQLLSEGVLATNILAMTFTTAAATEMRDRVGVYVGKLTSKELNVSTFHSFCLQLCRSHAEKLGRSPDFLVYGHGQQRRAVIEATRLALPEIQLSKDVGSAADAAPNVGSNLCCDQLIDPKLLKERAKKWDKFVSQAKAAGRTPEFFEDLGNVSGAAVLRHYNATLAACDALDYHDFINCAAALLRDNPEVLEQCLSTWTCLLVDEFQDTSKMQYELLCLLASHKRVTVVGDDDQSIFSFNGADSNNFETFRKDFSELKEVRLQHNYRSTRCIVEAATSLIGNNIKRCENKQAVTDNDYGEMISVKECRNDDAQCCFAIDTIITKAQITSPNKPIFGNFAILYRRQVTGKIFQSALRSRKIPFNVHGVAFYRKKIVKIVVSMLWTALDNEATHCSRVFKALYGGDRAEAKKVVEYVDKVAKASQCKFLEAARRIFTAKVSGTFSRRQIACGRKVLTLIDAVHRLARKETTLSTLVTAVTNLIPQRSAFQKRAIIDADEGKFLNEDNDPRTILEYILDDVTDFLSNHFHLYGTRDAKLSEEGVGCLFQLRAFLDHTTLREHGNFKMRSEENKNSVTLTTMHQSKGLEWDTVFIVKANDSEIPLLHEARGSVCDGAMSIEEERRLFYVGMTRAKKKLYILYLTWDSNQQLLSPTRFLRELPRHLLDYQVDNMSKSGTSVQGIVRSQIHEGKVGLELQHDISDTSEKISRKQEEHYLVNNTLARKSEEMDCATSTDFLKGFNVDARSTIASIFHTWAKKPAFQDPKRLLDKVCFVLDERMRSKASKNKDTLRALKCCLNNDDALLYAQHVLRWMRIPQEERALMLSEKQEYFQHRSVERSMGAASATDKQVSYLRNLGCTIEPTSRLHASRLIEQYKKL